MFFRLLFFYFRSEITSMTVVYSHFYLFGIKLVLIERILIFLMI